MRNNHWLKEFLNQLLKQYFPEIPFNPRLIVKFGRKAKTRLGSIRQNPQDKKETIITVNGLLQVKNIPLLVIKATLIHELSHYAHGFNSPLQQKYRFPHAGGIVRAEFRQRGLEQLYVDQKRWLKANWPKIVERNFKPRSVKVKRVSRKIPHPFWFRF